MLNSIRDNIEVIRKTILASCQSTRRDPDAIKIVAISKGFGPTLMEEAFHAGIVSFGENYLQEAWEKQAALQALPVAWHFTGHLQRNKASIVAERFQMIQSLESIELAKILDGVGRKLGRPIPVLVQVKCHSKGAFGVPLHDFQNFAESLMPLEGIEVRGMMTMGPPADSAEAVRPYFRDVYQVFVQSKRGLSKVFCELSMGMSGDYPVAVEEGSTMLRLGRAIYGERSLKK